MKVVLASLLGLSALLVNVSAHANGKSSTALDCKAVEITASEFEEAFTVEEYPEVRVEAIDKSNPMLPAIMREFTVSVGANSPYKRGQDGVRTVRDESEGQGHQKYVVVFTDGRTITVEAQRFGSATLSSSDNSFEAVLVCE